MHLLREQTLGETGKKARAETDEIFLSSRSNKCYKLRQEAIQFIEKSK